MPTIAGVVQVQLAPEHVETTLGVVPGGVGGRVGNPLPPFTLESMDVDGTKADGVEVINQVKS